MTTEGAVRPAPPPLLLPLAPRAAASCTASSSTTSADASSCIAATASSQLANGCGVGSGSDATVQGVLLGVSGLRSEKNKALGCSTSFESTITLEQLTLSTHHCRCVCRGPVSLWTSGRAINCMQKMHAKT
eukprot:256972-Prymnesium_polylepis.1